MPYEHAVHDDVAACEGAARWSAPCRFFVGGVFFCEFFFFGLLFLFFYFG